MAHDVFISYSSQDKAIADAACARLESRKIRCWIAPRDVSAGQPWASALVNAINTSRVMVLILSERSNNSQQVLREVDEAVSRGIPILPLRIDTVEPSDQMRYYIKSIHWLDALSPPLERHLEHLADSAQALLSVEAGEAPPAVMPRVAAPAPKRKGLPVWAIVTLILAAGLIVAGIGGWAIFGRTSLAGRTAAKEVATPESEAIGPTVGSATGTAKWSDWQTLSFNVANNTLWTQSGKNSYTPVDQTGVTAFLWSDEIIAGDLILSYDITCQESRGDGGVVVYGDGYEYSQGNLFFIASWDDTYMIGKHNPYEDFNYLANNYYPTVPASKRDFAILVEISGDHASLSVDGHKFPPVPIPDDIVRRGKIGFTKYWEMPAVTYSNIKIKTRTQIE